MGQVIYVGCFPTPEEASLAVEKRRAELQANPIDALEVKPERALPLGVSLVKGKTTNPYLAHCSYKGKQYNIGYYPSVELAKEAYEEKMGELREADPKPVRDLPDGVIEGGSNNAGTYYGKFTFHGKTIRTSYYPKPEEALKALEKKRAECLANPEAALKLKPPRDLPKGVCRVAVKSKKIGSEDLNVSPGLMTCLYTYKANVCYDKKQYFLGCKHKTPQLAFEAVNKKREELGLPLVVWDWANTKFD